MKKVLSLFAVMSLLSFAGCGGSDEATGTGVIQGTVESFEAAAPVAARAVAAVPGIVVYIDGPVSRNTMTDADGAFSFTGLPAGDYSLRFTYNGEEVTYRGQSGQTATVSVAENQTVEVTSITVSGGNVNIGNIKVVNNGEAGNTSIAGTWRGTANGNPITLTLAVQGAAVSGSMAGWPPEPGCDGSHALTGTLNGNALTFTTRCALPDGDVNDWTVTVNGNTMSGGGLTASR